MASNKKVKLNDNVSKKVKAKDIKYISEEAREVRRFVVILFSIIIVVLGVYVISKFLVKDDKDTFDDTVTPGAIDYDIVSVGTMLNHKEDEYYVLLYDFEDARAVYYSALAGIYTGKEKAKQLYYCDLGNKLNEEYYVGKEGKSNPKAQKVSEFAFRDVTLVKVKNGKVVKYLEDIDTIKKELGI